MTLTNIKLLRLINTSTNALTIRLKDDPNGAGLQTAIPDDSKIKRRWKYD